MFLNRCPACTGAAAIGAHPTRMEIYSVGCLRCGKYEVTGSAQAILHGLHQRNEVTPRQAANLSGWLRERPGHLITEDNYTELLDLPTPTVAEKAEKILT